MRLAVATLTGGAAAATLAAADSLNPSRGPQWHQLVIEIPGVPGPYCLYGIEKRLRELNGIAQVELLWREERIRVILGTGSTITPADVRRAIQRAEYPYRYSITP